MTVIITSWKQNILACVPFLISYVIGKYNKVFLLRTECMIVSHESKIQVGTTIDAGFSTYI